MESRKENPLQSGTFHWILLPYRYVVVQGSYWNGTRQLIELKHTFMLLN